jgi:hypothetical protein
MLNRRKRHKLRSYPLFGVAAIAAAAVLSSAGVHSPPRDTIVVVDGYQFVVPAGSPVQHWRKISKPGASGLELAGKFLLSGKIHYFSGGAGPGPLTVAPDKTSAARLPRWQDDASPGEILLDGDSATEAAVLPSAVRGVVDKSETREASGPVSLYVDQYTVIVDGCGVSEYSARLLSVRHAGPLQLVTAATAEDC